MTWGFTGVDMPEAVSGSGINTVGLVRLIARLYSYGYRLNINAIEVLLGPVRTSWN